MNCPVEIVTLPGRVNFDAATDTDVAQRKLAWLLDNDYKITQRNVVCLDGNMYGVIWLEHQPVEEYTENVYYGTAIKRNT
jgi:hypothetical protein